MAQPVMQKAFHAGEWGPQLNARVDLAKYHSAAQTMENYYVDYRGGASSRAGTRYILQCYKSEFDVRVINFQASFQVGYTIEMGDFYFRFFNNGAAILEDSFAISAATATDPVEITVVGHDYIVGDWIFVSGVGGMTQLNGRYFIITAIAGDDLSLGRILDGADVDGTGYSAYTTGGTAARVYTLPSPYAAEDLAILKFTQNVNTMIFDHPDYVPYVLTLIAANNWTLIPQEIGSSVVAPANPAVSTTLSAGSVHYAYVVTAVDANGQESAPSAIANLASKLDLRTTPGTNQITWTAVSGAQSYNVYKAEVSYSGAVLAGAAYGFIGNVTGVGLDDSNIEPDFSQTPPIPQNPFQGAGVASVAVTSPGSYTTVPTATLTAAPSGGQTATVSVFLGVITAAPTTPGTGDAFDVGDLIRPEDEAGLGNILLRVETVNGANRILTVSIVSQGSLGSGSTPTNPVRFDDVTNPNREVNIDLTWGVTVVGVISPGSGYIAVPTVTFSAGAAAATAVLASASAGNPTVPAIHQQRLWHMGLASAPQQFHASQPGAVNNFDKRNPILPDDAISGQISAGQLNTIKAAISMPTGLITLSDKAAWLINAGASGAAVTPIDIVANAQAYNGCSDVPPIVANFDILYVQAKGSVVRDLTYNFYANIFTGTDISVLSSHLFFGYMVTEWAWAEEPFKLVWGIRSDGTLLSLTFMKEQDLIGWAHSVTQGDWKSVCVTVEEVSGFGNVDAPYFVVEREVDGNTVKYIERMAERFFPALEDCWCVDAGLKYDGAPATDFSGGEHLAGMTVTGLADGVVIEPFVMPADGTFELEDPASVVIIGLAFTCDLLTLNLDTGEPTTQGKRKKVTAVTVRAFQTLGIKIGTNEDNLVVMKDFQDGNVGSVSNRLVDGLTTGDGRTTINPDWNTEGTYLIRQDQPYPAQILGVIPEVAIGDTKNERQQ